MTGTLTESRCMKLKKLIIEKETCVVCFDDLVLTNFSCITSCGHVCCLTCMEKYLDMNMTDDRIPTCVSCRGTISSYFKIKFTNKDDEYEIEKNDFTEKHGNIMNKKISKTK